jgi:hypothetical protein
MQISMYCSIRNCVSNLPRNSPGLWQAACPVQWILSCRPPVRRWVPYRFIVPSPVTPSGQKPVQILPQRAYILYFFENPIGFQRRMIDFGKQLLFTRCLKMYSFFAFTFKVCKVLLWPKYFFCQKVNMGVKINAEFWILCWFQMLMPSQRKHLIKWIV